VVVVSRDTLLEDGGIRVEGALLNGRYRLLSALGAGGMGKILRAEDRERGIEVAVKLLHDSIADRASIVTRFAREAELASRMHSRNVVRVLDRGFADELGVPFIVYELLEGTDLAAHLEVRERLPLAETGEIITQVCRALERAHAVGVVHRDIKPANLFLCREDGRLLVKVLDFGIAKVRAPSMRGPVRDSLMAINVRDKESLPPGSLSGTLEHMSPEHVLDGVPTDALGDLYAVGVVGYRCLTGRVPFEASALGQLVLLLAKGPAPAPSTLVPGVPPAVDAFFAQAIHRDPSQRFPNANAMARAAITAFREKA